MDEDRKSAPSDERNADGDGTLTATPERFGAGRVRPTAGRQRGKSPRVQEEMCWVLSDPLEWSQEEMASGAKGPGTGKRHLLHMPWASNFLRALNIFREDTFKAERRRTTKRAP